MEGSKQSLFRIFFLQRVKITYKCGFPEISGHVFKYEVFIQQPLYSLHSTEHAKDTKIVKACFILRGFCFPNEELKSKG